MRKLTLIKKHPNVQLGHLYEHLLASAIDSYFYSYHIFESIDYISRGTTYEQAGIIAIDIDFYTDAAWSHKDAITALGIDLGADNINVTHALYQIATEEPEHLYITDKQQVLDELAKLDDQPWVSPDDLTTLDTKGTRRTFEPIYLTNRKQVKQRAIHTTLALDTAFLNINRTFAPLFNVLSRFILVTIEDRVAPQFGYYSGELSGTARPLTVTNDMFCTPRVQKPIDTDKILRLSQDVAHYMLDQKTINRIAQELQNISYENDANNAPDIHRIIRETGILIGLQGWRAVATPENIRQMLNHTSLTVKYGRQKSTLPLVKAM